MGMDTEGVTALLNTLATLDSRDMPGDFPLDVMLLPYTVSGDAGLAAMRTILGIYFANNGLAIHFNVFDAEEYRDAQKHPEKYENLQVRVCGWNVRWNDLPKVEQDKYLARADAMAF
jgi:formate C-acetyltransferase